MADFNGENQGVNNKKLPEIDILRKKNTFLDVAREEEMIFTRGDVELTFLGKDFQYKRTDDGSLKIVDGRILAMEVDIDGEPIYQIGDINVNAKKFIDKVIDGKLQKVLKNKIFDKKDVIWGSFFNDKLFGFDGNDTVKGWGGNDQINGGLGNDKLIGYTGDDVFVFDTKLNAKKNVDHITDFNHKHDSISLDKEIFSGFKKGELSKDSFITGKAKDEDPVIQYKENKGTLFYNPDGSGDEKKIKFAKVDKHENLSHDDFFVI